MFLFGKFFSYESNICKALLYLVYLSGLDGFSDFLRLVSKNGPEGIKYNTDKDIIQDRVNKRNKDYFNIETRHNRNSVLQIFIHFTEIYSHEICQFTVVNSIVLFFTAVVGRSEKMVENTVIVLLLLIFT